MKLVSIAEGKAKLSEYVEECRRHAVVLTKHGHPRAALVPLEDDDDLERFLLSRKRTFPGSNGPFGGNAARLSR